MRAVFLTLVICSTAAHAFCGFYVSSAGGQLFNDATMVVLMRDGTRTVLSMQNNYRGPPEDFALVIPVPVVLQKENVKTLPKRGLRAPRHHRLAAAGRDDYEPRRRAHRSRCGFGMAGAMDERPERRRLPRRPRA